jgi:MFS family permease
VGSSAGNLVEWCDFYAHAFTALHQGRVLSRLRSDRKATEHGGRFAIGFLMRPIGGWISGRIADRHGRRTSMLISVVMMGKGSLVIATCRHTPLPS